jgi:hypothetical protein
LVIAVLAVLVVAVAAWHVIPLVRERNECIAMGKRWLAYLESHPAFSTLEADYPFDVRFTYADSTDDDLRRLRDTYDLRTVAGQGSEPDQIINLMSWVYSLASHGNEPAIPEERNAFTFIHQATVEQKQINCYMKTVILNEVYLSMGFPSRHTHLLPYSEEEEGSHFITSVYSRMLGRWILMDPDFGIYVTDEQGEILGVDEVRRRLAAGDPLVTVRPGRSSVENAWEDIENFLGGVDYSWFLSCFVFKVRCPVNSKFAQGSVPVREYYELIPEGYREELLGDSTLASRGKKIYYIGNEDAFWQGPALF